MSLTFALASTTWQKKKTLNKWPYRLFLNIDFLTLQHYTWMKKSGFANNKNRIKKKTNEAEFEATHI